jgi:DUF1707 SHOCT-like domain
VTAQRDGDTAAATTRRGHLQASHADREHVLDVLKVAFVQGRLTKAEFDLRVSQTLASRTYAELDVLTADFPAGLIEAQPPPRPAKPPPQPARAESAHPQNKVVNSCAVATLAVFALAIPVLSGHFELFFILVAAMMGALLAAAGRTAHSAYKKRH